MLTSVTYKDGTWHEGNVPLLGSMDHAVWLSSVVFDGARTVTKRRLKPGTFTIQPGGTYSTLRAIARDFAGNDGRPLTYP